MNNCLNKCLSHLLTVLHLFVYSLSYMIDPTLISSKILRRLYLVGKDALCMCVPSEMFTLNRSHCCGSFLSFDIESTCTKDDDIACLSTKSLIVFEVSFPSFRIPRYVC